MQKKFRSQMTVVLAVLTMALALMPGAWAASNKEAGEAGKMTVTVLYNFDGTELIYPAGPNVAQGRDGSLYSTTSYGGTYNDGVVFKITPNGDATVIQQLRRRMVPAASLWAPTGTSTGRHSTAEVGMVALATVRRSRLRRRAT